MNYRHAFHAGNFADVFKHVLLSRILVYLMRKPAPLRYIDTHAGLGWYDLAASEPERTGEWRTGIGRLNASAVPADLEDLLAPYLETVGSRDDTGRPYSYPGSPGIAQHLLRPDDRLLLCERHPEDAAALRSTMRGDRRIKVLEADGNAALNGAVPPPERRGLVLLDPPFEDRGDFDVLVSSVSNAHRKWATGVYALWYPIKDSSRVAAFSRQMRSLPTRETCQIEIERHGSASELRGCGLFVINPTYGLAAEAARLLPHLNTVMSDSDRSPFHARIFDQAGVPRSF